MNTDSRLRKRLQSEGISQKPFLTNNHADDQYKNNWPSLKDNSLSCIRYVRQNCFPKNRIVLPRAHRLFPETCSTLLLLLLLLHSATPCVIMLCVVDFQEEPRGPSIPRLALFLSRVTQRLFDSSSASYSLCIPTSQRAVDLQV